MSHIIISDCDYPTMFPIECKNDIINFKILTPIRPSIEEVMQVVMREGNKIAQDISRFETKNYVPIQKNKNVEK